MDVFSRLQTNLIEVSAALRATEPAEPLPLYASSDQSLFYQGSLVGQVIERWDRIWRWIRFSVQCSVEKLLRLILTIWFNHAVHLAMEARQRRIWNLIVKIDQVWQTEPPAKELAEQRQRYFQSLSEELDDSIESDLFYRMQYDKVGKEPLTDQQERDLRHRIVSFHQAAYPFWSAFLNDKRLSQLLDEEDSLLLDLPCFDALKKEGRWSHLEGLMQQTIPIGLFTKLHDPSSLSLGEEKELKKWIKTLNDCSSSLSLESFSVVLNEIIRIIQIQGSSPLTLPDLLLWLDQEGCLLLHLEDPSHMDWRDGLKPGETIECNGKEFQLGEQLSPDKGTDDEYKIFALEGFPNSIVKIANNRIRLLIDDKKMEMEEEHWGVRFVEKVENIEDDPQAPPVDGLDADGRCVIQEKLSNSLDSYEWSSQERELAEEDERIAMILANHFFCMSQWKGSTQNLSCAHLMFDQEGILKSTRLLKKGPPLYNQWEKDCAMAAKGNRQVLKFLMKVSGLSDHKIAHYYREAVEHTLTTGKIDLISRPLPIGYRQNEYERHIKQLCTQAQELRKACLKEVISALRKNKKYHYTQEGELAKNVYEKLVACYQAYPTPGAFSPRIIQEVIECMTNPSDPLLDDSFDEESYYDEKKKLLVSFNDAALNLT